MFMGTIGAPFIFFLLSVTPHVCISAPKNSLKRSVRNLARATSQGQGAELRPKMGRSALTVSVLKYALSDTKEGKKRTAIGETRHRVESSKRGQN